MAFVVITNLIVLVFKFVNPPLTPLMLIRSVQQWNAGKKATIRQEWADIEKMSPNLGLAVRAGEDQRFYDHNGFDFEAIQDAIEHNSTHERQLGASTITQQTAKNLFLWPSRDWLRKGLEVYFTAILEFWWSKERILEVYLNIVELGDGIYGAEIACQQYFKHSSKRVTAAEAAALAVILPNPLERNPLKLSPRVQRRKNWILSQMRHLKVDYSAQ